MLQKMSPLVLHSHQETVLNIQQRINVLNFLKLSTVFFTHSFSSICKKSKKTYHFSSVSRNKEPIIKGRKKPSKVPHFTSSEVHFKRIKGSNSQNFGLIGFFNG